MIRKRSKNLLDKKPIPAKYKSMIVWLSLVGASLALLIVALLVK